MPKAPWRLAVDIGGTFTDVVLVDADDGRVVTAKALTTPSDLLDGVRAGVADVLERAGAAPAEVGGPLVHATTLVTNALIERKGARVAMVTTSGFGDLIEIRDERRFDMFDLQIDLPEPPLPREAIFELEERMGADGEPLLVPSEEEIDAVCAALAATEPEAVCVGFLHSYANDAHERLVAARLRERLGVPVVGSAEVAPTIREYPRFVTAVLNAATVPILGPYLKRLEAWLAGEGFDNPVLIMLSNGGTVATSVAAEFPIRAVESGPAAGALAGGWFARRLQSPELLCFDMGGTTAKACMIEGCEPRVANLFEIARAYRNVAGSGWPAAIPSVDLVEIGAGGGSIAALDALGRLAVGPDSAAADPGPACYGRGGKLPTVTDANLLLGYLDPERFAGGRLRLDPALAEHAVGELGASAGLSASEMAAGIHELVNQTMAAAAQAHATERGVDLRGTALLAFGGGGPIHGCGVAELLGARVVNFPPRASVLSAFGTLVTPVRMDLGTTEVRPLSELTPADVEAIYEPLRERGRELLSASGIAAEDIAFTYVVDLRYRGQGSEIGVAAGSGARFPLSLAELLASYEELYRAIFGLTQPEVAVEAVTWRLAVAAPEPRLELRAPGAAAGAEPATRPVRFGIEAEALETPIHDRSALVAGATVEGPAVIQESATTIVLRPGWSAEVLADGTVRAERGAA